MDYEKAYKEALERARDVYTYYCDDREQLRKIESIFPELKESEDERIRREMIEIIKNEAHEFPSSVIANKSNSWIAWLEKQGEQKPVDKVKPKFKVGDWITNGEYIWKVTGIGQLDYILQSQNGDTVDDTISYVDEYFHLWTIQDAKDGDVLMANAPFIFNGNLEDGKGCPGAHCAINTLGKFQIPKFPEHWTGHATTPATKEQCNLLFQKMKEAGYEWDFEKKELRKIDTRENLTLDGDLMAADCMIVEQKPAWSEEDEEMRKKLLFFNGRRK